MITLLSERKIWARPFDELIKLHHEATNIKCHKEKRKHFSLYVHQAQRQ